MNPTTRISTAEKLGQRLGRMWRRYARNERRAVQWLAAHGMPAAVAKGLLWGVKLIVLAALFYGAFWPILVLACIMAGTYTLTDFSGAADLEPQGDELRSGESGFGLYSSNGHRLDPHDPNDPFND